MDDIFYAHSSHLYLSRYFAEGILTKLAYNEYLGLNMGKIKWAQT